MLLNRSNPLCEEAEKYYYDFIYEGRDVAIPREIVRHMDTCKECRKQLEQLMIAIGASDGARLQDVGPTKADVLRLHLALVDDPVGCSDVRPFLPTLLDPATEVGIPTPVTAHIEKCSSCRNDLQIIRKLGLKAEQLQRLSQVFAENPEDNSVNCADARTDMLFAVLMTFRETDGRVLKHVCCCEDCRRSLYEHRESLLAELVAEHTQGDFPCHQIGASDIFDYVVPYGLDPSGDQYARFRESLTSHLRECPTCLGKMQQLHKALYGILERGESDTVTVFHLCESATSQRGTDSNSAYAGFPVNVDVFDRSQRAYLDKPQRVAVSATARGEARGKPRRHLLRTAAIIIVGALVGTALLFHGQPVQATYLDSIYSALEPVRNVHVISYMKRPDGEKLIQEQWVSQDRRLYLNKTDNTRALWEFGKRQRTIKDLTLNATTSVLIRKDDIEETEKSVYSYLNLIPSVKELKARDSTSHITGEDMLVIDRATQNYVLKAVGESAAGLPVYSRWVFVLDRQTNLPTRVEYYRKSRSKEYRLQTFYKLTYPSEADVFDEIMGLMQ